MTGSDPRVYRVFGGRLASEVELPGLPEGEAGGEAPDWTLTREEGPAPDVEEAEILAEDPVKTGVQVRLRQSGARLLLDFDDTGVFTVSEDGSRIRWSPGQEARADDVRSDVLGRVLPLALHRQGLLSLHASAVVTGDGAVAFLGPTGAGKSTMAMTLSKLGAPVLSDDAVPVEAGDPPRAHAGVSLLRLRPDVARATGREPAEGDTAEDRVEVAADAAFRDGATAPLAALYILEPDEAGGQVRRELMTGPEAAFAIMGELKIGRLLARRRGAELLRNCAALERTVTVYRLHVPRDLQRLDGPARFVLQAHGGAAGAQHLRYQKAE